MGGFIEDGVAAGVAMTLHKIDRNEDESAQPIKPAIDQQQNREFLAEQMQGRTDEPFRQCLEYHGFTFKRAGELPPLRGRTPRTEGEWRHKNPNVKLAFTVRDLAAGFRGAEDLDKYLRDQKLAAAVSAGKVPKEALTASRRRR